MKIKGFYLLLLTAALYGSVTIFIRLLSPYYDFFQQLFYPGIAVLFLFLSFSFLFKIHFPLRKVKKKYLFFYSLFYSITGLFFTLSVLHGRIIATVFSVYLGQFTLSLIIGHLFFHEAMTRKKSVSFLIALIGLGFFSFPLSFRELGLGFLFGLLAGISESFANAANKHLSNKAPIQTLILVRVFGGIILGGVLLSVFSKNGLLPIITPWSIILLILFAAVLLTMSYTVVKGFEYFDLYLGTIVISSEIGFAALFAILFFQEYPPIQQLIGASCIFLAVVVANLTVNRKQ